MSDYKEQFNRIRRFLRRIEDQNRKQLDYEDDFWAFCQNCWHLKDWIKNDPSLPPIAREAIEDEVKKYPALIIFADLANRSKHLELRPSSNRVGGKLSGKDVTIHAPTFHLNTKNGESKSEGGSVEYNYRIISNDGVEYPGLKLARTAIDDWKKVIHQLGI